MYSRRETNSMVILFCSCATADPILVVAACNKPARFDANINTKAVHGVDATASTIFASAPLSFTQTNAVTRHVSWII